MAVMPIQRLFQSKKDSEARHDPQVHRQDLPHLVHRGWDQMK
jgi:hypothetical protein